MDEIQGILGLKGLVYMIKPSPRYISGCYPHTWKDGENIAICQKNEGLASFWPRPSIPPCKNVLSDEAVCNCGFHCSYDFELAQTYSWANVVALVEGYGTVMLHETGFRASHARVVAILDCMISSPGKPHVYCLDVPIISEKTAIIAMINHFLKDKENGKLPKPLLGAYRTLGFIYGGSYGYTGNPWSKGN